MDDVDQILLSSIKEIGYNTDNDITNLKQCNIEELVSMVFYCLNTIRPDLKLPPTLPPSMSLKFKICTEVADVCKGLRYKGDIGYHTFLYNNRIDIRNVLLFLIEHVPRKVTYEEIEKTENKNSVTIRQKTAEKLKEIHAAKSKDPYGLCNLPFISVELETGTLLPNQKIDCKPLEWRDFVIQKLPFVDEQLPDYQCLLPSLISLNAQGLLNPTKNKHSQFNIKPLGDSFFLAGSSQPLNTYFERRPFSNELPESADSTIIGISDPDKLTSPDNPESEVENERAALESEKIDLKKRISELSLKLNHVNKSNEILQKTLDEKEAKESSLEKALMLLSNSEDSIPKLLNANDKCRNKMSSLEQQWKKHKEILLDRHNQLRTITDEKQDVKNKINQNILEVRKELFNVIELIEKRDAKHQKLLLKEGLMKGVQRGEYIQRILEIVKNIKKQGIGIDVILSDTRTVQKDINIISGKIERSFTATTQMLMNPKPDNFAEETRQLLRQIHTDISNILNVIGETGQLSREIKDLEEHVLENSEDLTESLQQVSTDLQKIKESQALFLDEIDKLTREKDGVLGPSQPKPKKKQVSTTIQVQAIIEKCEDDISHPLAS